MEQLSRVRVLHVTTSVSRAGGIEEYIRLLMANVDREQFAIGICSLQDRPEQINGELVALAEAAYGLGRRAALYDMGTVLAVQRAIVHFDADLVHTHNSKGNWHGRLAAVLAGVPSVTTHHDLEDARFGYDPALRARLAGSRAYHGLGLVDTYLFPFLNHLLNRLNRRVLGVSEQVRRVYARGTDDARVMTLHAPFDEHRFTSPVPRDWGQPPVVGCVGRLVAVKGIDILLRAVALLGDQGRELRLRVVGDGVERPRLERNARELGIAERVTFTGELGNGPGLYEGVDIYVQPSLAEGCSITLLEAMACALPVIATDVGGPGELIGDESRGVLVAAGDAAALAAALVRLLDDPLQARAMGQAAAQHVRANFGGTRFAAAMAQVYRDVLSDESR